MSEELVSVPQDLKLLSDAELQELEGRATAEFDRLEADDDVTPEALESLMSLTDGIERLRVEMQVREERARSEAERQRLAMSNQKQDLATRVRGKQEGGEGSSNGDGQNAPADTESIAAAAAQGATAALFAALGDRRVGSDLSEMTKRATGSLAEARRHAPQPKAPKPLLAVTAGVDIPGLARGAELNSIDSLTDAFHRRARGMPTTRDGQGNQQLVASVRNEFEHTIDDRTTPAQVEELFRHLTSPDKKDALLAAGGWCAPSEIRYEFFNVACEDGMIDLPTFGVSRGGVRFPSSPSLADAFTNGLAPFNVPFSNTSNPWLWTETDDENTVTGDVNKPCIRVPCPEFEERRLECYGICLTAGNLTDDAYPEATQNFLRLLMSAHEHAKNARYIAQMAAMSGPPIAAGAYTSGGPAYNAVLSGIALAATDYRSKFGMCEDDVLEVVIPQWIVGVIQADLAHRSGVDFISATRTEIQSYFADRNVRVQFVNDWQVRGAGQFGNPSADMTSWPGEVTFMIYAAGTFMLGNGLSLDLGVVRDSVLNAENDHTAAWSEECHLIAMVGHESRQYTVSYSVAGDTCCVETTAPVVSGDGGMLL